MKKIVSLMLALMIVMTSVASFAAAAAETEITTLEAEVYLADNAMPEHIFEDYNGKGYLEEPYVYKSDYEPKGAEGLNAVVNLKHKYAKDINVTIAVAVYDGNNKLIGCEIKDVLVKAAKKAGSDTAVIGVPERTKNAKAFCWSTDKNIVASEENEILPKVDVFCIGDSTGQDWNNSDYYFWFPQAGWGTYIGDYFNPGLVTVTNLCRSGAWAQSCLNNPDDAAYGQSYFYGSDRWETMEKDKNYSEGDYVIVSHGSNDRGKTDKDGKYSDVEWYGMAIEEMAIRTKEKGVNLIVTSAMPSAYTGDSKKKAFNEKAKALSKKYGFTYIDHSAGMERTFAVAGDGTPSDIIKAYYLDRDTAILSPTVNPLGFGLTSKAIKNHANGGLVITGKGTDDGHLNIRGANLACQEMIKALKKSDSNLKLYIK